MHTWHSQRRVTLLWPTWPSLGQPNIANLDVKNTNVHSYVESGGVWLPQVIGMILLSEEWSKLRSKILILNHIKMFVHLQRLGGGLADGQSPKQLAALCDQRIQGWRLEDGAPTTDAAVGMASGQVGLHRNCGSQNQAERKVEPLASKFSPYHFCDGSIIWWQDHVVSCGFFLILKHPRTWKPVADSLEVQARIILIWELLTTLPIAYSLYHLYRTLDYHRQNDMTFPANNLCIIWHHVFPGLFFLLFGSR